MFELFKPEVKNYYNPMEMNSVTNLKGHHS
jgi:hypothetical protein